MAKKTFCLRPTADISLEHKLYPEDSPAGYLLISDDEEDSYIYSTASYDEDTGPTSGEVSSVFKLDGILPEDIGKITNIYIEILGGGSSLDDMMFTNPRLELTLFIDNTYEITKSIIWDGTSTAGDEALVTLVSLMAGILALDIASEDGGLNQINFNNLNSLLTDYIKENNKLPEINLKVSFKYDSFEPNPEEEDPKITSVKSSIKDICLKIEYTTFNSEIYLLNNKTPVFSYFIKDNGSWKEIEDENTALSLLQSNKYYKNSYTDFCSTPLDQYPILSPGESWKKNMDYKMDSITIVDSYIPNGTELRSWPIDLNNQGEIMCYQISENELIIAGNGSGGIYLHPNSERLFKFLNPFDFSKRIKLDGWSLLHSYTYTDLTEAFYGIDFANAGSFTLAFFLYELLGNNLTKAFAYSNISMAFYPSYLEVVDEKAFQGSSLELINLTSDTLKEIKKGAFNHSQLTQPYLSDSIFRLGEHSFSYSELTEIILPKNLISIDDECFSYCTNLTKLPTFPEKLEIIGAGAFGACPNMEGILTFPESIKKIGAAAFSSCEKITEIIWTENITEIPGACFNRCFGLVNVSLPQNLLKIGSEAFANCKILTEISIPQNVISIGEKAFQNCLQLKTLDWPRACRTIDKLTFYGCESLENFKILNTVTKIEANPFAKCPNLVLELEPLNSNQTQIFSMYYGALYDTRAGVLIGVDSTFKDYPLISPLFGTTIGESAFEDTDLTNLSVPKKITKIEAKAFNSSSLQSISFLDTTPPTLAKGSDGEPDSIFYPSTSLKIYVPAGSLTTYKNSDFSAYASYLVESGS